MPTDKVQRSSLWVRLNQASARAKFVGRSATSQYVVLPVLFVLALNSAPTGFAPEFSWSASHFQILLEASLFSWLFFTVFGFIVDKIFSQRNFWRALFLILLYATTETLRTVSFVFFANWIGITADPQWAFRISAGAVSGILFFSLLSTFVNDARDYRRAYAELAEQRFLLGSALTTGERELANTRAIIVSGVREKLERELRKTMTESERQKPRYKLIVQQLFDVVETVVRPASHELFDRSVTSAPLPISPKAPRVKIRDIVNLTTTVQPFRPWAMGGFALLFSVPAAFLAASIFEFLWFIAGMVLFCLLLWLAKILIAEPMKKWHVITRIVFMILAYAAVSAAFTVSILITVFNGQMVVINGVLYGIVIGEIVCWLIAGIAGLHAARQNALIEVTQVNEDLLWQTKRVQAEIWAQQKALALDLHNDVQANLLAAALRLRAAIESKEDPAATMEEVRILIDRTLNFEAGMRSAVTFADVVTKLTNTWMSIMTFSMTAHADVAQAVERDPVAMRVIEDVVTEFQTNALKHGKATHVNAVITRPDERLIVMTLANNGSPLTTTPGAAQDTTGLGTRLMTGVALSYRYVNQPDGVQLTVQLPLRSNERQAG